MQHWGILIPNYSFIWNSHFIGHPVFDLATQIQVKGYVVIADHNYQGIVHRGERGSTDPACGWRARMWVVPIPSPPRSWPRPSWRIKQLSECLCDPATTTIRVCLFKYTHLVVGCLSFDMNLPFPLEWKAIKLLSQRSGSKSQLWNLASHLSSERLGSLLGKGTIEMLW